VLTPAVGVNFGHDGFRGGEEGAVGADAGVAEAGVLAPGAGAVVLYDVGVFDGLCLGHLALLLVLRW
jgi:hypothetical protein